MSYRFYSPFNVVSVLVALLSIGSMVFLFDIKPRSPIPVPQSKGPDQVVRVVLMNGCGRAGLAVKFASLLRARGYDVLNGQGSNADSFDFDKTMVVDRKGNRALARDVAKDLGIKLVIDQYGADPYIMEDCEIIIGKDWDTLSMAKEVQAE